MRHRWRLRRQKAKAGVACEFTEQNSRDMGDCVFMQLVGASLCVCVCLIGG